MIRRTALRHLAAYSVSLPTIVATAKVAKETVYMPSAVAARVLGNTKSEMQQQPDADLASNER